MINLVLEGARGLGKSSVAKWLRENTTNSTLINFTGFNEKGNDGLRKVVSYYNGFENMFRGMKVIGHDYTFIHDRYFFSEMVYSKLYKDYNFTPHYYSKAESIHHVYNYMPVIFFYSTNIKELERNLTRDKVQLFGEVSESVNDSLIQQVAYLKMAKELENMRIPNVDVLVLDVSGKSIEEIGKEILAFIN
jgi:deoxyguanosine kinase